LWCGEKYRFVGRIQVITLPRIAMVTPRYLLRLHVCSYGIVVMMVAGTERVMADALTDVTPEAVAAMMKKRIVTMR